MTLRDPLIEELARLAVLEDVGTGDLTTRATTPHGCVRADLVVKQAGVVAGSAWIAAVCRQVDPDIAIDWHAVDGDFLQPGAIWCSWQGEAASILVAERPALNGAMMLGGIATLTHQMVKAIAGTGAKLLDTRKTAPGMRALAKAAVRAGGGFNHRMGLFDGVLIKDNHIAAAGGIAEAVAHVRGRIPTTLKVEIECGEIEQVEQALEAGAEIIMLDNMDLETMREAVRLIGGRAKVEASGNVTLTTIRAIAETGVDYISSGALTHSAPALDLSLRINAPNP
ncbi:MAG: nicotinate-nucleotide diphosphorylase (carboxylating) [Alphaproteobacteria bacterium CG_4_10_14_0_2_um_filter_63_37]|nr:MAG: nicotinate-nucleotide diphosphorylase (carboxylating) [Proteobacteria bacterium CG1_02_64_396]PJA25780.1 MAG: nicotinate-nucleotide diphosphorylase (carboxylating) [Alphaproteobacteria bacterium CG_4_10_14_0_2_um_filter_63_37]